MRPCGWNAFDAYLFDIDGTLLHCTDAVHYFAFCNVLTRVAGRPVNLDGVIAHGNVDTGILRDAWALAGVREEQWRPRLAEIQAELVAEVERSQAGIQAVTMPYAVEMLHHLRARGAKLGVATGNLEAIGRLKLARCALADQFDFAGWSDAFEHRKDVFAHALHLARSAAGTKAIVCAVGDTPADVRAAQANGLAVIAVATGVYTMEELQKERPTWCVASFADLLEGTATEN